MTLPSVFDKVVPPISIRGFVVRFGRELAGLWELAELRGSNRASRSSTWRTWVLLQNLCPSAVGTPRSVNAAAIACGLVTPSACIPAMMGASAKARAFARIMPVLRPTSAASRVAPALRRGVVGSLFDGLRYLCIFSGYPIETLTGWGTFFGATGVLLWRHLGEVHIVTRSTINRSPPT
jgi:hypothetical protein